MNRKAQLLILILTLLACGGYAQRPAIYSLDSLASKFIIDLRNTSHEKVLLNTDKSYYAAGETIWFKANSVDALSNRLIRHSKIIYVDLVDDRDSVINQLLLNNQASKTSGQMMLSPGLREGYYWLRGYTDAILGRDSSQITVLTLYIVNPGKPDRRVTTSGDEPSATSRPDTGAPRMIFFPEGGSIVSGTKSTVAFESFNSSGQPMELSGYVTDTRDSLTTTFKTSVAGLGKFSFDAWNPRKYTAHVKWKDNKELTFPLPRINQFAYQLSLLDEDSLSFHLRVSLGDSLYKKNKLSYILGISGDSLCFAASGNDMYDVDVPKSNFPVGKATIFLFNDQKQIVSQRAVFISGQPQVSISTDKLEYGNKEKVKLDIVTKSRDGHALRSALSLSVSDGRTVPVVAEESSASKSVASSAPGFAFSSPPSESRVTDQTAPEVIDLIMRTQKEAFVDWLFDSDLSSRKGASPKISSDINRLTITGKVVNKNNEPASSCIVDLFSQQKDIPRADTTDMQGRFRFDVGDFDNGSVFTLKLTNLQGQSREGKVILDEFAFPHFPTPLELKRRFEPSELTMIRRYRSPVQDTSSQDHEVQTLSPVTVTGESQSEQDEIQNTRVSKFSYIIPGYLLANGDPNALVNAMKQVPGLNRGLTLAMGGRPSGEPPLIVVDGVPQSLTEDDDNSFLMALDANSIEYVEVLRGAQTAIYGMQAGGGVILINSRHGTGGTSDFSDKGIANISPKGFAKQVAFPVPQASNKDQSKHFVPNLGSTIYWNSDVLTDADGKATVEFYAPEMAPRGFLSVRLVGLSVAGEKIICSYKIKYL